MFKKPNCTGKVPDEKQQLYLLPAPPHSHYELFLIYFWGREYAHILICMFFKNIQIIPYCIQYFTFFLYDMS